MASLYVRTSSAGTGPAVQVTDLGLPVPTSATWTLLNSSAPGSALGSNGQFTGRELRDSQDLYDAIRNGDLEWSKDGVIIELAADYVADYVLLQDLSDDDFDLSGGKLVVPRGPTNPTEVRVGDTFFNTTEQLLYVGTSSGWETVEMAAPPRVILLDEVSPGKLTYVGEAPPGTATTVSGWRIYRLDESGSGDEELIKLYANDSTSFDQVWDDRLSLSYVL